MISNTLYGMVCAVAAAVITAPIPASGRMSAAGQSRRARANARYPDHAALMVEAHLRSLGKRGDGMKGASE